MKYILLQKDMDDQVANRIRFERYGHKEICGNCKFFDGSDGTEWGFCHSPAFNRSVEVTTNTGRKTLEDAGGSFVRFGFSCPFFRRRGDTQEGGDLPPWGRGSAG